MSYAWGETANEPSTIPPWSEWFAPANDRPGYPTPDEAAERPEQVIRRLQTENVQLRTIVGPLCALLRRFEATSAALGGEHYLSDESRSVLLILREHVGSDVTR